MRRRLSRFITTFSIYDIFKNTKSENQLSLEDGIIFMENLYKDIFHKDNYLEFDGTEFTLFTLEYETDEEYKSRLLREEETQKKLKSFNKEEYELYKTLKKKYSNT